jgi:hypothetical protein
MADPTQPAPIPTYTPFWRMILQGFGFAAGAMLLYAAFDYARDGKLDMRRLGR